MRKFLLLVQLLSLSMLVASQPITMKLSGDTYALVVGISNYQEVDTLQYAHRDALAFAQYLMSPAGGNLPPDHVNIKTNELATAAEIELGLDWLLEKVTNENDRVIIFFSGHGDVESKTIDNNGYLLTYNTPRYIYSGALSVHMLNSYIRTLSARNAQVILILDACRAGDLAGKSYNGSGMANEMLTQRVGREIRLMSCQPNEFSIEGEQWGNGRGAFSFHLIDGLTGLADENGDNKVTLKEIRNYLEEKVPQEAKPNEQNPVIKGEDINMVIGHVNPGALAELKKQKHQPLTAAISDVIMKGFEDELLSGLDTGFVKLYYEFLDAIRQDNLTNTNEGLPAYTIYNILLNEASIERLHSHIKRKMVAALMNNAQTILNNYIKGKSTNAGSLDIQQSILHLELSSQILGANHYLHNSILSKKLLFEAALEIAAKPDDQNAWTRVYNLLDKAIQLDTNSAIVYNQYGMAVGAERGYEYALPWYSKALQLAPQFGFAHYNMAFAQYTAGLLDSALMSLDNAIKYSLLKTDSYNLKGLVLYNLERYREAMAYYKMVLQINPLHYHTNYNVALWYETKSNITQNLTYTDSAIQYYAISSLINPNVEDPYLGLINIYLEKDSLEKAQKIANHAIQKIPGSISLYKVLGSLYNMGQQYEMASSTFREGLKHAPNDYALNYNLAWAYQQMDSINLALHYATKALHIDSLKAECYKLLSRLHTALESVGEGILLLKEASMVLENDPEIWHTLANLYFESGRYQESIEPFEMAASIDGQAFRWYNVAIANEMAGHTAKARNYYRLATFTSSPYFKAASEVYDYYNRTNKADSISFLIDFLLDAAPGNSDYLFMGANHYTMTETNPHKAKEYWDQLLDSNTAFNYYVYESAGYYYGLIGEIRGASEFFQLALDGAPAEARASIYYNLACAYSINGKKSKSFDAFEDALENGFDDWALIDQDKDLEAIRKMKKFEKLINAYK